MLNDFPTMPHKPSRVRKIVPSKQGGTITFAAKILNPHGYRKQYPAQNGAQLYLPRRFSILLGIENNTQHTRGCNSTRCKGSQPLWVSKTIPMRGNLMNLWSLTNLLQWGSSGRNRFEQSNTTTLKHHHSADDSAIPPPTDRVLCW